MSFPVAALFALSVLWVFRIAHYARKNDDLFAYAYTALLAFTLWSAVNGLVNP